MSGFKIYFHVQVPISQYSVMVVNRLLIRTSDIDVHIWSSYKDSVVEQECRGNITCEERRKRKSTGKHSTKLISPCFQHFIHHCTLR